MWLQAHPWHQNSHCEYEYDYDRILIKNTCNLSKLIVSLLLFFYGTIYALIVDPQNDQLPVGLIAQLVGHCTRIAEVRVNYSPPQARIFLPFFPYYLSSIAKLRRSLKLELCNIARSLNSTVISDFVVLRRQMYRRNMFGKLKKVLLFLRLSILLLQRRPFGSTIKIIIIMQTVHFSS